MCVDYLCDYLFDLFLSIWKIIDLQGPPRSEGPPPTPVPAGSPERSLTCPPQGTARVWRILFNTDTDHPVAGVKVERFPESDKLYVSQLPPRGRPRPTLPSQVLACTPTRIYEFVGAVSLESVFDQVRVAPPPALPPVTPARSTTPRRASRSCRGTPRATASSTCTASSGTGCPTTSRGRYGLPS